MKRLKTIFPEVLAKSVKNNRYLLLLPFAYMVFVSLYMIWHRAWFSPDQFFAFALIGTLLIGRVRQFIGDWLPVLIFLWGYEYLRGLAPLLNAKPHIFPMINADIFLFGYLPTTKLQESLYTPGRTHWYDYLAVLLYISHFIIPMAVAYLFWLFDRRHFRRYTAGLLLLSYMAFITFVLFPAMPPWMASENGFIPPMKKVMDQVISSFANPIDVPSIYRFFGVNLVAAVPSIHAAFPWLIFLSVVKYNRIFGLLLIPYVAGVWFAVVYLGEHYFVDVLAGCLYATVAYMVINFIDQRRHQIKQPVSSEVL